MVIDHISYAVSDTEGDHTLIACFINSKAPVLFEGVAHTVNAANSLVLKVISASPAACSANPKSAMSSPPELTGSAISLISGVQKPGSSTKHVKSGNEQFLTELNKWIFHDGGHLKAVEVRHHEVGEADEPAIYRIKDELEYSVEIYVWSGASCEPYVADDVQVQFYMMSPYVLKTLSTDTKGLYFTSFKVPDVYGVFQFKMECQRLGCSSLSLSKQVIKFLLLLHG
ncbi:dolichyl-diphosphooligosaccharide--protein glycosyltransferase 48 kDa subunit [Populus trichocarpa]|uniref:dolichyl-diphosphooligosaccharide--protein glycosyltransferase 48 kDa subunit n=1 Tax=Populus trichocarpa TaxID=3694 RepID=UPI000D189D57|nr:dolichyl-diphosphooligosaccharide--protein glycosyltransferase 48 kDa subunit [Populus trichocarpa]|eukprot:XP_024464552.1 dolichyl-diphosphooligosaccharide--protein glycosyltransferase 48 kDa subunit [Populus trichocarpa]